MKKISELHMGFMAIPRQALAQMPIFLWVFSVFSGREAARARGAQRHPGDYPEKERWGCASPDGAVARG
jgi:hypothetical protein